MSIELTGHVETMPEIRIEVAGSGPSGPPGDTPYIGENGNWWIGKTDTGMAASGGGIDYQIGPGLRVDGKTLSVDTADRVEPDNTKPVTSAAVHVEIGNIEVLLAAL